MPPIDEIVAEKPNKPKVSAAEPSLAAEPAAGTKPSTAAKPPAAMKPSSETEPPPDTELIALTIDITTGRIVTVERVDAAGAHHGLTKEEKSHLVKAHANAHFERLIEQAFEAGIECVLGAADEKEPAESKAEVELSHLLLQSLIERSRAKNLIKNENITRAIVGTLIGRSATTH